MSNRETKTQKQKDCNKDQQTQKWKGWGQGWVQEEKARQREADGKRE